jgi:hypothetical protein
MRHITHPERALITEDLTKGCNSCHDDRPVIDSDHDSSFICSGDKQFPSWVLMGSSRRLSPEWTHLDDTVTRGGTEPETHAERGEDPQQEISYLLVLHNIISMALGKGTRQWALSGFEGDSRHVCAKSDVVPNQLLF